MPDTVDVPPSEDEKVKVKVSVVIVKGSINSLKVAVGFLLMGRSVAPFTAPVELTVGAVVSAVEPVVQLTEKSLASALPARSFAPVVIVTVYSVLAARLLAGVNVAVTPV